MHCERASNIQRRKQIGPRSRPREASSPFEWHVRIETNYRAVEIILFKHNTLGYSIALHTAPTAATGTAQANRVQYFIFQCRGQACMQASCTLREMVQVHAFRM